MGRGWTAIVPALASAARAPEHTIGITIQDQYGREMSPESARLVLLQFGIELAFAVVMVVLFVVYVRYRIRRRRRRARPDLADVF